MDQPAIMLYLGDWRGNANLRRCSWAARGAMLDVMALMHDSPEYGLLRWTQKEIAQALGCPLSLIRELIEKTVLRGADTGTCEAYTYVPRSGGRDGTPVPLIVEQAGPIWYSRRMVRDEYVRHVRGKTTRYRSPKGASMPQPMPPIGTRLGDGPSVSVSVSVSEEVRSTAVEDGQVQGSGTDLLGSEVSESVAKKTLRQTTSDAVETYNLAPFTKRNGGTGVNALMLGKERERLVQRALPVFREIAQFIESPGVDRRFFELYWETVDANPFWSGRQQSSNGREPYIPTFESLMKPDNIRRICEKHLSDDQAPKGSGSVPAKANVERCYTEAEIARMVGDEPMPTRLPRDPYAND